jgi:hypothetical protein
MSPEDGQKIPPASPNGPEIRSQNKPPQVVVPPKTPPPQPPKPIEPKKGN